MEYGFTMALITLVPARLAGMEDLKKRVPWRSDHQSLDAVIEWAVRVFRALAVGMIILSIGVHDWPPPAV
ncbi:MAG: hypothetical protein EOP86_19605 [Verrucomicrobiaceae bacterium]|nr:MAG: hypothetical protein EOP86_19605 [Verrucomicrobiaceae bacterium]